MTICGNPDIPLSRLLKMYKWLASLNDTTMWNIEWGESDTIVDILYVTFMQESDAIAFKLKCG